MCCTVCECASTSRMRLRPGPNLVVHQTISQHLRWCLTPSKRRADDDWCPPPPSRLDDRPPTARGWAQLKIPQPPPVETTVMHEQPHNHEPVYRYVATERFHSVAASSPGNVQSGPVFTPCCPVDMEPGCNPEQADSMQQQRHSTAKLPPWLPDTTSQTRYLGERVIGQQLYDKVTRCTIKVDTGPGGCHG